MTLPNPVPSTYLDQGSDDPRQARVQLQAAIDALDALLTHLGLSPLTASPLTAGDGLEVSAATLRAKLNGGTLLRSAGGLSVNVGAGAGQIVALDASGRLTVGSVLAALDAMQAVRISGVVVPAVLSAATHNLNPTGQATAAVYELAASSAVDLTGLAGGSAGRIMILDNVGAFAITLKEQNAGSLASAQFKFGADFVLAPGAQIALRWKASISRWIFFSGAATGSGGWTLADSVIAAGGETSLDIDMTSIPADAAEAMITWHDLQPAVGTGALRALVSLDGFSTFDASANYKEWGVIYNNAGGAAGLGSSGQAFFQLGYANQVTHLTLTAAARAAGRMFIQMPRSGERVTLQADLDYPTAAATMEGGFWRGVHSSAHSIDGLRLYWQNSRTFVAGGQLDVYWR